MSRKRMGYWATLAVFAAFSAHAADLPEMNPLAPKPEQVAPKPLDPVLADVLKTVGAPTVPNALPPVDVPAAAPTAATPMSANVTDVNKELVYRAALGRADDVKLLLAKGANPNQTNNEGIPLLLVAAARKDSESLDTVQALLEGNADVNIKDKDGQTALYYAVRSGQIKTVELLLRRGIDYYSLDNSGNIARTVAFRAGRSDIVDLMDSFVKGEAQKVESEYQRVEKTAGQLKAEAEAKIKAAASTQETDAAMAERKAKVAEQVRIRDYKRNLEKLGEKVHDISYHACAFQYWSFCQALEQTTDLSEEEMDEVIDMHREAVQDTSLEVMKMFDVGSDYVNQIINPSKQSIYDQLSSMPSRTFRKENGVGQLDDVTSRCERIAKSWEIAPPKQDGVTAEGPVKSKKPAKPKTAQAGAKQPAVAKPLAQQAAEKRQSAVAAAAAKRRSQSRTPYTTGSQPKPNNEMIFKNGKPVGGY